MKSNIIFLSVLISIISGFLVLAGEACPFENDEETRKLPLGPDHLIPIDPYPADYRIAYNKQLTKHHSLEKAHLARMVARASFGIEYSLRMDTEANWRDLKSSKYFFLIYTITDKNIWYSMPENNSGKVQETIKPTTLKASIPAETALKVIKLWDEMILQTRYSRTDDSGLDGVTIEFSSRFGHGETWSPSDGTSPAMLHKLGEKLITYCKTSKEGRKRLLKDINTAVAKLEAYLTKKKISFSTDKKEKVPFRITQLLTLVDAAREAWPSLQGEASWPKDFSGLFQGLRFPLKDKVTTEADHLKAITIIPEHLMKGQVVSATLLHNGWYFSSIDDIDSKKPSWSNILATKKGEKFLQFGFTW
ncbi:MAG: hypothetical protein ACI9E1_000090 [Cryomorphaceae bacterium]|jgi:hypothetical protein